MLPFLENLNWQAVNTILKVFEVENQVVIFAFLADMAFETEFDNEMNIDLFMYWLSLENYLTKVLSYSALVEINACKLFA